jgi:hypothetical protein
MRGALVLLLVAAPCAAVAIAAPAGRGRSRAGAGSAAAPATPADRSPIIAPVPTTTVVGGAGVHPEGQYGGVSPGELPGDSNKPAKPKHLPAKGTLTWIGFEAKDGGAEVFFQSVAPFTLSQHVQGTSLVVYLGLPHLGHNTWRQIDTRFFDNPLSGIVARSVGAARATKDHPARGAGIEAKIAFKNAKDAHEASVRTTTEADGMYYAYLSFGEGAEPSAQQPVTSPTIDQPEVDEPAPAPARPSKPAAQAQDNDQPDAPKSN